MLPNVHSIFLKCIAILVVSCGLLTAIVSYLGERAGKEIAVSGVVAMAANQTTSLGNQLYGPVRFKKVDDLGVILEEAVNTSNLVTTLVVINLAGEVVSSAGADLGSSELALITNMANEAIASNAPQVQAGGLILSYPIQREKGGEPVGAVATIWTTAPFLATISRYQRKQLIGAGIALVLLTVLSTFLVRSMISQPIDRISSRAFGMAEGDLASLTPDTSNKGEIGRSCAFDRATAREP